MTHLKSELQRIKELTPQYAATVAITVLLLDALDIMSDFFEDWHFSFKTFINADFSNYITSFADFKVTYLATFYLSFLLLIRGVTKEVNLKKPFHRFLHYQINISFDAFYFVSIASLIIAIDLLMRMSLLSETCAAEFGFNPWVLIGGSLVIVLLTLCVCYFKSVPTHGSRLAAIAPPVVLFLAAIFSMATLEVDAPPTPAVAIQCKT